MPLGLSTRSSQPAPPLTRRDAVAKSVGALGFMLMAAHTSASAEDAAAEAPGAAGASSGDHDGHVMDTSEPAHQDIVDAALHCVKAGDNCLAHCIKLLGSGDTSIKGCMVTISSMLPMCATLARLGALDAARLKEFAKVCMDVCDDCQKECDKHAGHHEVCKICRDSCTDCSKTCKKLLDS